MRRFTLLLFMAAAACGIDALGTATDLAPSANDGGGAASSSSSGSVEGGPIDEDGGTAIPVEPSDASDDEDSAPLVACTEDGGVRVANHCYFPIEPMTQPTAKQACVAAGAHLVTVTSAAEHTLLATVGTGDRWIGLEAPAPSNDRAQYNWVTGEPKSVTYWYVNDPDNMGPCVALHGTLQEWVDRGCGDTNAALCERE